jgi:hypothetical protein
MTDPTDEGNGAYFTTANGWTSLGTVTGQKGSISWLANNLVDLNVNYIALGFKIKYCPVGGSPDDCVIYNLINRSDGSYFAYIVDNSSGGGGPTLESINGSALDPMAGTKASEPVVVAESSTPNPLFGGSYSSVIYGAGQKVGIKILALADDPNHTPLTDAPVAIKNDITVDANNTWSWRYTLGSTVHPLTTGEVYALTVYRVSATGTPAIGSKPLLYVTFEPSVRDDAGTPTTLFIPRLTADTVQMLKMELQLTDKYGNVIAPENGTTVTVSAPYLPNDTASNVDTDQVDPLFNAPALRTVDESGNATTAFVAEGVGRATRYVAYLTSAAPTLDLTDTVDGAVNLDFGETIEKAIGYGLNVFVNDPDFSARNTSAIQTVVTAGTQAEAFGASVEHSLPMVKLTDGSNSVFLNTGETPVPLAVSFNPSLAVDVNHLVKKGGTFVIDEKYTVSGVEQIQLIKEAEEYFRITLTNESTSESVTLGEFPDTLALRSILTFEHQNASFDNVEVIACRFINPSASCSYAGSPETGEVEFHNLASIVLAPGESLEIDVVTSPAFSSRILTTTGSILSTLFYEIASTIVSHPAPTVGLQILNPAGLMVDVPAEDGTTGTTQFTDLEKEILKNVARATRDPDRESIVEFYENNIGTEERVITAATDEDGMVFTEGATLITDPPSYLGGSVYYFRDTNLILDDPDATFITLPSTPTTIIVRGDIIIKDDLVLPTGSSFGLIALQIDTTDLYPDALPDTVANESIPGGIIFVAPSVTGIQSDIFAQSAILSYDEETSTDKIVTSLTDALTAPVGGSLIYPVTERTSTLLNQLVMYGLIATNNTWNGSLKDKPYGEEFENANLEMDLTQARVFATHREADPIVDGDADGEIEQTPNDYVTDTVTIEAKRSFLLTGFDPADLDPRSKTDYNRSDMSADYNSAVVVGRISLQTAPAPLFTAGTTTMFEETTKKR